MDFIVQNYVWFIVGGVIILMAVIGYIADKTDFGRKGKEENKIEKPKKEKKAKEKKEKIKVEPKGINELTQKVNEKDKINIETDQNPNVNMQNITDNVQATDVTSSNENIDQSLFAPLTDDVKEVIPQDSKKDEPLELKSVEPAKLETSNQENNSQKVAEDEDIWKF